MVFQSNTHRRFVLGGVATAGLIALAFAPAQANAQDIQDGRSGSEGASSGGLAEIVVTAQRRAENQQDVPISIAAIPADTLANTGVDSTIALSQMVPAVQFTRSGPSGLFFVRGVGTTNAAAGEEGSNAFYIDGVYLPDLGQTINNFNNVERIEVLKGPQGTLFGRNAFGGLVHVITKEPGDELKVAGEATYGNYQTARGRLYVAAPLAENVSMDIALTGQEQSKGWGRNLTLNTESKKEDYWGVRSKLVVQASDALKLTLAGDYYDVKDNTGLAWRLDDVSPGLSVIPGVPGPLAPKGQDTTANDPSLTHLEIWGFSLTAEADLGFATLTSISAMRNNDNHSYFDTDGGPQPLIRIDYESGSRSYQQELRLASNTTDPLSWQVGGFYLHAKASNDSAFRGLALGGVNAGQNIVADLKTDSYALFGEVTYAITPRTMLTGGLRYTKDKRKFDGSVAVVQANGNVLPAVSYPRPGVDPWTDELSYNEITYRAAIRHEFTDDVSVYASYNRGFKAGSFSLQSPNTPPVKPMFIDAYEIGIKSELFDRRLRVNVAAFHYDISDYQVRSAATATAGSSILLNAASVKVDGVDVEFQAAPTDNWQVFGGFTWLDSRFSNYGPIPGKSAGAPFSYPRPGICDAPGTTDPGTTTGTPTGGLLTCFGDATGNQTPLAPDFAASIGTSVTFPVNETGEVRVSALYSYNSGYPFEGDGLLRQKSFSLLNASAEYRVDEHWGVELWGRNITNTAWFAQKAATGTGAFASQAAPRTYGVTIKFDY